MSAIGNYVAKYCLKPSQLSTPKERELNELIKIGVLPSPFRIMSHGLGQSYINRMKRFHVPTKIRSPSERVSTIVDRSFYYEGTFKYKLPRYYRDRLYREKFPFDTKIWNPKKKIYENKIVYRYASKGMLARQMQIEIRNRLLAEYNERFQEFRSLYKDKSDTEIHLEIERLSVASRMDRQKNINSKMSRFYNFNRFKNRKF